MSIISFISQSSFDPEMTEVLTAAFDAAWQRIKSSGNPLAAGDAAAATRETLAKNIIAAAQAGERDQNRLVESALSRLGLQPDGHPSPAEHASST